MKTRSMLNWLKARPFEADITDEIKMFEEKTGIRIPPIYKVFCETYELGEDTVFLENNYYLKKGELHYISLAYDFLPYETSMPGIEQIFELDIIPHIIEIYHEDGTYDEETESGLSDKELLPIIKCSNAILIKVGYGKENVDQIYLYDVNKFEEEGNRFVLIANNIFHFMRGMMMFDDPDGDMDEEYEKLYKNWTEDFWRMRE